MLELVQNPGTALESHILRPYKHCWYMRIVYLPPPSSKISKRNLPFSGFMRKIHMVPTQSTMSVTTGEGVGSLGVGDLQTSRNNLWWKQLVFFLREFMSTPNATPFAGRVNHHCPSIIFLIRPYFLIRRVAKKKADSPTNTHGFYQSTSKVLERNDISFGGASKMHSKSLEKCIYP